MKALTFRQIVSLNPARTGLIMSNNRADTEEKIRGEKLMRIATNLMCSAIVCFFCFIIQTGCVPQTTNRFDINQEFTNNNQFNKTIDAYLLAGKHWGRKHWEQVPRLKPTDPTDPLFVKALINRNYLDFFWIHSDLKEAFKKGYRMGYEDRTADLVLGPHIEKAAIEMGESISTEFVAVIEMFERNWIVTLRKAIDVFIVLIAEGSQADREGFIKKFTVVYREKYNRTQNLLKSGGFMAQHSEGGTLLHIDMTKVKAVLDIPSPESLKTEIYHQTFKVMGDEMGRRYSHNLIGRNELIEWLRRSKTALQEVPGNNLGIIYCAFVDSYGTDAANVFKDLIKEAGYRQKMNTVDCTNRQASLAPQTFVPYDQRSDSTIITIKKSYSTVNIRPVPSKDQSSIAILSGGTEVQRIGVQGNWINIRFIHNGIEKTGWIYKTLVE